MESDQDIQCLRCGGTLARQNAYCSKCGLDLRGPDADELRDLEATERQIQRLSKGGLLEKTLTRRLQSVIEDRRRMLGVKGFASPNAAIETTPPAAARKEPPVIPDSSSVVAPRPPEPLAPALPTPVPIPQPAPLQSKPAATPAQIPSAPPEAPKDKTRSAPISLGFSHDKPIATPPVEPAVSKASTPLRFA